MITMKIEIPVGSNIKYEVDKETGEMRVDRTSNLTYPCTYGYIKETLADDGDQLDVFLLGENVYVPGSIIDIDIIGMIKMNDNGEEDNKVVAKVRDVEHDNEYIERNVEVIKSFLRYYKKGTVVGPYVSRFYTVKYYAKCKNLYRRKMYEEK